MGNSNDAYGGFGGGAAGGGTNGAGGGGGYTGGYGSCWSDAGSGGGSYNIGEEQVNVTGGNEAGSHGYVNIELQCEEQFIYEVFENSGEYTWLGNTYNSGGLYTVYSGITQNGCDSINILNLTMPTGNGITLSINPTYTFNQTIVDSISSVTVSVYNDVVDQFIYFDGLESPFEISVDTLFLEAEQQQDITISFSTESIGTYSDTLNFNGNVFGGGQIIFNGDGIQVEIILSTDFIFMDTVSIGQSNSSQFTIFNTGIGTLIIDSIVMNGSEELFVDQSSLTINEGDSVSITLTYNPINSGEFNNYISIFSNDPNAPEYVINISAVGISEVFGSVCGVWFVENSPYTLVGDITIPDSCTLIIEPGVSIVLGEFEIEVFGGLQMSGNENDSINLIGGRLVIYENANVDTIKNISYNYEYYNPDTITYGNINSTNEWYIESGTYSYNYEQFTSNSDGLYLRTYSGSSGYTSNQYKIRKRTFEVDEEGYYRITTEYKCPYSNYYNNNREYRIEAYYKINNGNWIRFFRSHDSPDFSSFETFASDLIFLNSGDQLDIYFYNYLTLIMTEESILETCF